ncbi:hypothetical protein So717_25640 [Roseobacter cerasinus]|uniref:Uncharacterized protein n=1 Tax=Roseobacter cerasinus TaxID=2602289 RepID=A0A640VUN9_9RHOB|nr:hypothetical protein So717_25640 [Roseobacter cerasinus]
MYGLKVANGNVDPRIQVTPARFQQNDGVGWVGTETVCKHTACRPRSDDDEISFHFALPGRYKKSLCKKNETY